MSTPNVFIVHVEYTDDNGTEMKRILGPFQTKIKAYPNLLWFLKDRMMIECSHLDLDRRSFEYFSDLEKIVVSSLSLREIKSAFKKIIDNFNSDNWAYEVVSNI